MRHTASLVFLVLAACKSPAASTDARPTALTVMAINDFHGALYETLVPGDKESGQTIGGLPWLKAAVDHVRSDAAISVLIDGGDEFQGSWPVNATHGRGSVEAFDLLGVDATAIGNHEFDYGGHGGGHPLRGALERNAAKASYPLLSANIRQADGTPYAPDGIAQWSLIEREGVRVAVIGLSTQDTPQTTIPTNVADLTFIDVVQAVNEVLPQVQAASPHVTILAAHLTGQCEPPAYLEKPPADCMPSGELGRLLTELPPGTFDVMVIGHAHTLLQQRIGDTFVLESRAKGHVLSRLDLVIDEDGVDADASKLFEPWALIHSPADPGCSEADFPLEARDVGGTSLAPNPDAIALVDALEAEVGSLCSVLGCTDHDMGRSRQDETELGNWIADATLAAFPEADIAIQNAGGIRADLPKGKLRREQLQNVMPFDNRTLLVEMTGADVQTMFRIGSSGGHGLLQVSSGSSYGFDPAVTDGSDLDGDGAIADWEHDRLCGVTINGEPIDPDATYKVVTSDFLFTGGDHLGPAFANATKLAEGDLIREQLYSAAETTGAACVGSIPLMDEAAPRIRIGTCAP